MVEGNDYDTVETELTLEEFVMTKPLPLRAKVTVGYDDPFNSDNSFSTGDVIEIRRFLCPFVAITYADGTTGSDTRVAVPTSNPTRFRFPAPLSTRSRMFSSVRQLVTAWPIVVVARSPHKDIHPLFAQGDKLRMIRSDRTEDSKTPVLELKNLETLELVRLSYDYLGTFAEATSTDNRLYTLGELAEVARVPRELVLRADDRDKASSAWIPGMPWSFSGFVQADKPDYLVEVQAVTVAEPEDQQDDSETARFLVSIDSDITVIECESDYVSFSERQCYLRHLANKPPGIFPRIVSVLSWKEETTILQNHCVRPGDRLVLYELQKVKRLAVSAGNRRFFLPLDHPDLFRLQSDGSHATHRPLSELVTDSSVLPLTLTLADDLDYVNLHDLLLPRRVHLTAKMIVDETAVVAAKVDRASSRLQASFRLPIRTNIQLQFFGRWKKSPTAPDSSRWDSMAEELSKNAYHSITETNWSGKKSRETIHLTRGRSHPASSSTLQRNRSESDGDTVSAVPPISDRPPPLLARSISMPQNSYSHRRAPPPPPQPMPTISQRPLPCPLPTGAFSVQPTTSDDDDYNVTTDYESPDCDDDDYEEIMDDTLVTQTESLNIPADGNVSAFSVHQLQQLMQHLSIPTDTLSAWNRLEVDGKAFSEMTDNQLASHGIAIPLVLYFRDRSRLYILPQL